MTVQERETIAQHGPDYACYHYTTLRPFFSLVLNRPVTDEEVDDYQIWQYKQFSPKGSLELPCVILKTN